MKIVKMYMNIFGFFGRKILCRGVLKLYGFGFNLFVLLDICVVFDKLLYDLNFYFL